MLFAVCAAQQEYMTQSFIDSTIQIAFYGFHQAQMVPGADVYMQRAIVDAKEAARRLKRMARGNINEKYILWKVSELESQILLEERELLLKKLKAQHESKNELIERFNKELGTPRPDFSILWQIHAQMNALDPAKAREIESSANQRSGNVSRDLLLSIERAVVADDLQRARKELGYCTRNRQYLTISDAKYDQLQVEISARVSAGDTKVRLARGEEQAGVLLAQNRLSDARAGIGTMNNLLVEIQPYLAGQEWSRHNSALSKLAATLAYKEDSLLDENLRILKTRGVDAGVAYYEDVVRALGVREDKLKVLDNAILAMAPSRTSRTEEAVSREIDALSIGPADDGLTMEAVRREARRRADSIAAEAALKARILALERARQDSVRAVQQAQAQRILREKQDEARRYMVAVYDLLENDKIRKANRQFQRTKDCVKEYIGGETYAMLETRVLQAYSDRRDRRKKRQEAPAVALVKKPKEEPPDERVAPNPQNGSRREETTVAIVRIYELLEAGDAESAYASFEQIRPWLQQAVPGEVFEMLASTLEQARSAMHEQHCRQMVKENMARIYDLLEQNHIKEAYAEFERNRDMIRKYAGDEPYAMLESIVSEAYEYVR